MLDAFSCDVAILAMRVNHWINGGGLRDLRMGLSWYDGYVVLVGVIKKFLLAIGINIDTVSLLIIVDVVAFIVGFSFLLNYIANRTRPLVTLLVAAALLSCPGVLPVVFLGHGHTLVFMFLAWYIWMVDRLHVDERGLYVLKQFFLVLITVVLISVIRPQDGLFSLPGLGIIFLHKVGGFNWRRSRLVMYISCLGVIFTVLFVLASWTTYFPAAHLLKIPQLFTVPVVLNYVSCFIYGMGLLAFALFFPKRNFSYWLAGTIFVLGLWLAISTSPLNFEFRFVFPAIAFWTVVLADVLEHIYRNLAGKSRFVLTLGLVVAILWQASLVGGFFVYRMLGLNRDFVLNIREKLSPDIVIAQDTAPFFKYYADLEIMSPPVDPDWELAERFWRKVLKLRDEGKNVLIVSSAFGYDKQGMFEKTRPRSLFLSPVYGGYFLDWHGCHGIIPSLRWENVFIPVVKEGVSFEYGKASCSRCSQN